MKIMIEGDRTMTTQTQLKTYLKDRLSSDAEFAQEALLLVYSMQTTEEQIIGGTRYQNKMGFNGTDGDFGSSLAVQLQNYGRLSDRQMGYVFRMMPKYWKQVITLIKAESAEDVDKYLSECRKQKADQKREAEERKQKEMTIREKLEADDDFCISAMYMLTEKNLLNDRAVSFVTSLYNQHKRKGSLSEKQISALRKNLKYHTRQIVTNIDDLKHIQSRKAVKTTINTDKAENVSVTPQNIKVDLYDFQKEGLGFLTAKNGLGLIADDMGLGKTIQVISYLAENPDKRPALIIVPASLKINWQREIRKFMINQPSVQILSGTKPYDLTAEVIIINYDIVKHWEDALKAYNFKVMILDEAHKIKNVKAQRSKAVKRISKTVPHRIALTGTPITNRPIELYNILDYLSPGTFKFWGFAQRYCGATHTRFGWDFSGASNKEELHEKINRIFMIRRRKEDVLKQLPNKQKTVIPFELDNVSEYKFAEAEFIEWLREKAGDQKAEKAGNAEALVKIEYLKQLSVKGKMKQSVDWIKDFLETDQKLVVFATHTETLDLLQKEFPNCVRIDGSTSQIKRDQAVQTFQNDSKYNLIIGNINAMGVGLTLTASSSVLFLEFPWTPADLQQAEDRVHRIGQEAEAVNIFYAVGNNTIDERIIELLEEKQSVINAIIDGKASKSEGLLSALLSEYK